MDEVTLSFAQIETLVGVLPASAYLRWWWTVKASGYVRSQRWRQVGWDAVPGAWHAGERRVTFVRRQ